MVLIIPIIGPWLAFPILTVGFSLLFISILPGINAMFPALQMIATLTIFLGLA